MKTLSLITVALALAASAHAQERTAGQAYDAQVNWGSLKNSVDLVSTQNKAMAALFDKVTACNAVSKFYAPSNPAHDTNGCVGIPVNDLKFETTSIPPNCGGVVCRADAATSDHVCKTIGYNGASGYATRAFDSPGDNIISRWDGSTYKVESARASGNLWMTMLSCYRFSLSAE